ncbi:lymphoid-specific helicase-like [Anneissia japonica]|uniref:lymphoid-specific helicase-like n=1 Tax=Anneissia japonica TaxID=1529436 RepID=UPI001425861B|nr:lymphoid-specific helicase-like [Anneissia japonica]
MGNSEKNCSDSPVKPDIMDSTEPSETACTVKLPNQEQDKIKPTGEGAVKDIKLEENIHIKVEEDTNPASSSSEQGNIENYDNDLENVKTESGLITADMLEEEKKLHDEAKNEEKKRREEAMGEHWQKELDEQRYKRLQHLLQKSNIYSKFLLAKMEQQQKQELARQERQAKKKALEEKAKAEAKSQPEVMSPIKKSRRIENKLTESADSSQSETDSPNHVTRNPSGKIANKAVSTPLRKTRRGQNAVEVNQMDHVENKKPSKRGRKRKNESYNISDYLDKEELAAKKLKTDQTHIDAKDVKQKPTEAMEVEQGREEKETMADEKYKDTFRRRIKGQKVSDRQPKLFTGGVMRQYQLEGLEWLKVLYENGVNGILGDEMGLGKTIQCIALFSHMLEMGVPGPYMVCAPLSTLPNWFSEFTRFAPKVPVILYHGTIPERELKRHQIRKHKNEFGTQPVVITSFEIAMRDCKHLNHYLWKYIIVDEGHRIKNMNCRLIRELKTYRSANRLLLTGTPLQNNLSELWSMLNFLLPEVFDDLNTFESWFDFNSFSSHEDEEAIVAKEREQHVISMMHQILTPFLLRRLKSDVDLTIPPKKEIIVNAPMTSKQQEFYKATLDKSIIEKVRPKEKEDTVALTPNGRPKRSCSKKVDYSLIFNENETDDVEDWYSKIRDTFAKESNLATNETATITDSVVNIKLQNIVMQLRKCCNHPYLLEYPLDPVTQQFKVDEELVQSCGKLLVLERLLPELKKRGHKVLIFSQMTSMLDILQDYCYLRKYNFCRLDGSMAFADRQQQIKDFSNDPEFFIFLLSTRAGGLGINLTSADTVIIYDSDWNPQSDLQAQDRCHRIGQDKPVVIYRLVTANTIDQKIVERAAAKRKLEKMVIHQGKFKGSKTMVRDSKAMLDPMELLKVLRSTDHSGVIQNCKEQVISDSDLELLLDRSDLLNKNSEKKCQRMKENKTFKILEASGENVMELKITA